MTPVGSTFLGRERNFAFCFSEYGDFCDKTFRSSSSKYDEVFSVLVLALLMKSRTHRRIAALFENSLSVSTLLLTGSIAFDGERHRVSAAQAQRRDPPLGITARHFVKQRHQDAGAGGTDGMSEGNGAAVDVGLRRVEPEFLDHRQGLHRESFVQLEEVHILEFPA